MLLMSGLVVLASAGGRRSEQYLFNQSINLVAAFVAGAVVTAFDYRKWAKLKWLLPVAWSVTVALLTIVLFTRSIKGSRRWIDLKFFNLQPGEIAKIMAVIIPAWWAASKREGWMAALAAKRDALRAKLAKPGGKKFRAAGFWNASCRFLSVLTDGYLPAGCLVGVMVGLLLLEPDFGTTLVVCGIAGLVMFIAGLKWKHTGAGILIVGAVVLAIMWHNPNRRARLLGYINRAEAVEQQGEADEKTKAKNYQLDQSLVAFGNAMRDESITPFWDRANRHPWWNACTGVGYMKGMQKLSYLPEHHTDFIFAVGAEELGFFFSAGMLLLYTVFFASAVAIGVKSPDAMGRYLAIGMGALVYFQALYNIGVVTGAFPAKGLALPFFSYGGTHLIMEAVAVGTILSVSFRNSLQNRKNKSTISFIR